MKKVTSQDVADLAGVSQATVSLVLNKNSKATFSSNTREKVLTAAHQLGYRLPPHNQDSKNKPPRKLLILTPTLTNYYYTELLQSLQEYARINGHQTMVCNTYRENDIERYNLEHLGQVDGIIYTFLTAFPRLVEELAKTVPVVLIGEKKDDFNVLSIELSNRIAGALMAEHLCELGHREFVFISTPLNRFSLSREQRLEGLRDVFQMKNLSAPLTVIAAQYSAEKDQTTTGIPYEFETGRQLALEILDKNTKATAFICVNDMTALGAMAAVKERGLSVPGDISVCGFDNTFLSTLTSPSLTTVDHHLRQRCKSAIDSIMSMWTTGKETPPQLSKIEYLPQLIVRDSTGPRKK